MAISFFSLVYAYIISDYSIKNVYFNSHHDKPLIYKISGVWGNHEGSILLFSFLLTVYNFIYHVFVKKSAKDILAVLISSCILSGFLLFIVLTSNPFDKILFITPTEGVGLNPVLQDLFLAIHPPMLYLGYIGYFLLFAMVMSALINNNIDDKNWINNAKKCSLMSFSFLTLGIGLGSWWAYRELGWGGYWFWDPVENSSFMPWLTGVATLHSLYILEKRGLLKIWTILLSIITFCLCLMGLFLVRSGVLTSVHSFSSSPERGLFILTFLFITMFLAFLIFVLKAKHIKSSDKDFNLVSKEGFIIINNFLLIIACFIVFVGTLYPLFIQVLANQEISVGHPYFNMNFLPLTIFILLSISFVPKLKFIHDSKKNIKKALIELCLILLIISIIIIAILFFKYQITASLINLLGITLFIIAITVIINNILYYLRLKRTSPNNLNKKTLFSMLSHISIALIIAGIILSSLYKEEKEVALKIGDKVQIAGYSLNFKNVVYGKEKNYFKEVAEFEVYQIKNDTYKQLDNLYPERRFYPIENSQTTETAIQRIWLSDLYIAIGNNLSDARVIRIYHAPFINLIWIGTIMLVISTTILLFLNKKINLQ